MVHKGKTISKPNRGTPPKVTVEDFYFHVKISPTGRGKFVAECQDLDIRVEGASRQQARDRLREAVKFHVQAGKKVRDPLQTKALKEVQEAECTRH